MNQKSFSELAEAYEAQTSFHSFAHIMRNTRAYDALMLEGWDVVPFIIAGFKDHLKDPESGLGLWGMNWVLVLTDITKVAIEDHCELVHGFQAWSVGDTCKAWITWYEAREARIAPRPTTEA